MNLVSCAGIANGRADMIVSVVKEEEWLPHLAGLPLWKPPDKPLLVVAPHPDDETLAAGGLIAAHRSRSLEVTVAAVTDGEKAYHDYPNLAAERRIEQTEALARLGVSPEKINRFELPDSAVASREEELADRLTPLMTSDTHVLAPWTSDFHPDHEACGRAAREAASRVGASVTFYFFWTWHFANVSKIATLVLQNFPLNEELLRAKSEALLCHRTQLEREGGEPVLPESLLAPARRAFETFAAA